MKGGMAGNREFGPIDTLRWFGWPERASLIIRHAERTSLESGLDLRLTEKGRQEAEVFGRQLVRYDHIRLYYSPNHRCHDTAQAIAESARQTGAHITAFQEDEYLDWITCFVEDRCIPIAERRSRPIIRSLFSRATIRNIIERTFGGSDKVMRHLVQRMLENKSPGVLDVNVSHDWDILTLRENCLGMRFEEYGLIDYLDGVLLFPSGESVMVAYKPFARKTETREE